MGDKRRPISPLVADILRRYPETPPKPKRPAAPVLEFPPTGLAEDRVRQAAVAEQDRARREQFQRVCDRAWQANLDRWAEEERRRSGGCHRGPMDPDWSA